MSPLSKPLDEVGVLHYGTELPTAELVKLYGTPPLVIRGARKVRLNVGAPGAAYAAFHLAVEPAKDSLSAAIEGLLIANSELLENVRRMPSLDSLCLHFPLYIAGDYWCETFECSLLNKLQTLDVDLRLDFYFDDLFDVVDPPLSVTDAAPHGTTWFGGEMDLMTFDLLDREHVRDDPFNENKSNALDCPTLDAIPIVLKELLSTGNGNDRAELVICCNAISYRKNRELQLSSEALSILASSGYDWRLEASHISAHR